MCYHPTHDELQEQLTEMTKLREEEKLHAARREAEKVERMRTAA